MIFVILCFAEKEGKAFHISYKDKLLLVAYSQQVLHGQFLIEKSTPLGYLDVIGRDRRYLFLYSLIYLILHSGILNCSSK